ncbi:MAG: hypothetical protein EBU78_01560 [Proteobacteria bacterium]|jgi:hypothetical protein|uniref:Tetratricopeptide repeat-like domain-containing protein n=1 Tax=Candidatus Fonsibacter lacus TaxID=2576439 RepID=A0A966M0X0_9PROT|nr:hypothetical protein [Candidatus Fonsibacter lacus]NBP31292.1 hypothetical protein [Candidatus Fonsibacter lacus]NBY89757.1 hypothetical protein [Candidatus Fonsibacter lacus]NCU52940.1 hypothetical protein [Candidatus Fonsibacter lacus]NDC44184.1 hypothetical protein [Pseudomonadota bacterium]
MNQIFNEIDDDLKKDRILNFFKKYKFIIIIIISLIFLTIFIIVGKNILFESRAKKNTQEYVIILGLINDKKIDEAKKRLEILKDSKINLYKVLAISKLLELSKENKNEQILILDYAIRSDIEKNDKDLFKIKKALLAFDNLEEQQFLNLLNPGDFKNSPWRVLSLEILGDFYLSKGQKIKAKDVYDQALKISDIPEIFKKDLEKKIKDIK